jgi:hypothetical protein
MTMRVSLQIDGDAKGAEQAAAAASRAVTALGESTDAVQKRIAENFDKATGAAGKFGDAARGVAASNDNIAENVAQLAGKFGELVTKVRGAESALGATTAGAGNIARGIAEIAKSAGTMPLVIAGLGFVSTAVQTFYDIANRGSREAEKRVEEHSRLVGVLRKAYDEAGGSVAEFGRKVGAVALFEAEQNLEKLRADLARQSGALVDRLTFIPSQGLSDGSLPPGTPAAIPQTPVVRPEFGAFRTPIENFMATRDVDALATDIVAIGRAARGANPEVVALAEEIVALSKSGRATSERVKEMTDLLQGKVKSSASGAATGIAAMSNEFERMIKSLHRQIAAQNAEAAAVGKSVGETARLRAEFLLLEAAQQANLPKTKELTDRVAEMANRFGDAAQKAAELRLKSDVAFEREQLGRGAMDAEVADRLRGVFGDRAGSMFDTEIAGAIRFNAQMRELKGLTMEFSSGLLRDFRAELAQGASAWEAFEAAGLNALSRLADRILDQALQNGISRLFGAFTGGGLSGLFGGSGVGLAQATSSTGFSLTGTAGLFDAGGYTGNIDRRAIAGYVHGREYVFDAESTARAGVPFLDAMRRRLRGYEGGGFVGDGPGPAGMLGGGMVIEANDNRTINFHGGGDIEAIKAELARDRAQRKAEIIDVVQRAYKSRELR